MKPWFEKEADIIKFPKPKAKVIRMPNVQEYPDFITGVQDLQAKQKDNTISQETYNKLYSDLIHRFMKKESFETPWFIREAPDDTGIMTLPDAKEKMKFINNILSKNPDIFNKVYKQLRVVGKDQDAGDDKFDPRQYLNPKLTNPEDDYAKQKGFQDILINGLKTAQGTFEEVQAFLKNYGKVSYINLNLLKTENQPIDTNAWLKEAPGVGKAFIASLYNYLFKIKPDRGPGEIALAFLSPQIEIVGKGDLNIGGALTEVKGQIGRKGGRFKDKSTSFGTPNLKFIEKEDIPDELKITDITPFTSSVKQRAAQGKINVFTHAQSLENAKPGLGKQFMDQMIGATYISAPQLAQQVIRNFMKYTPDTGKNAMVKLSFANYKNELVKKNFNHMLCVSPNKTLFFNLDNFMDIAQFVTFSAPEWKDIRNGAAAQISLK